MSKEVKEWLQKAENDLKSARVLLKNDPPICDTAVFHCQQATEKLLKAWLTSNEVEFDKVHSLTYLLDLCEKMGLSCDEFRDDAETLAPYAVEVRYPGDYLDISVNDAQNALCAAERIWNSLSFRFPKDIGDVTATKD